MDSEVKALYNTRLNSPNVNWNFTVMRRRTRKRAVGKPGVQIKRIRGDTPVGVRLYALREAKEVTQEELSLASRIAEGYISQLESGKSANPSLRVLRALANGLEVSTEVLSGDRVDTDPLTALRVGSFEKFADSAQRDRAFDLAKRIVDAGGGPLRAREWHLLHNLLKLLGEPRSQAIFTTQE